MIRFAVRVAAAAALAFCALAVQAQAWPTKPVHFIVPFPPGGSVDPLARVLGARLQESLGQQFIVENKPGASGSIGTAFVAKSAPDGYTYVVVFDTHAVNPALIPGLPYDTLKDLAPVMLVGTAPMAIVTSPEKPYKNFADVVQAAKAKPEALAIGSVGNGSLGHLAMIVVQQQGGFKVTHVPYKGGGPMMTDVMGKQIDLGIASVAALSANVKGGKLRALAVTGEKRSGVMPDVPTLAEQGLSGFSAYAWWGILAPAGTPKPIIDKFHAELAKALAQPDLRKQLTDTLGMDLAVSSPEQLQKFVAGEMDRWGKVVKANNVRAD
ncbi:MAG TPA: tripartite tricarboxylate transporter substrate binding protein, partial [Burkholderiales bacterium]|nr:tripartite tricarboxylate transporter substrate binding protein [Burkholderiales bacterium]